MRPRLFRTCFALALGTSFLLQSNSAKAGWVDFGRESNGQTVSLTADVDNVLVSVVTVHWLTKEGQSRELTMVLDGLGNHVIKKFPKVSPEAPLEVGNYGTDLPGGLVKGSVSPYLYSLPFKDSAHDLEQGPLGSYSHYQGSGAENAYDFAMDEGTPVCAARGGIVVSAGDGSSVGGPDPEMSGAGNFVDIGHDDGTVGEYFHFKHHGLLVLVGERVSAGQVIGLSGATGHANGPHLHFGVYRNISGAKRISLPIVFRGPQGEPLKLQEGTSYYPNGSMAWSEKFRAFVAVGCECLMVPIVFFAALFFSKKHARRRAEELRRLSD